MAQLRKDPLKGSTERGVSDILVVVFMFMILVVATALLYGFRNMALQDAMRRQNELKADHFREALNNADVDGYAISGLKAAAEQLVLEDPTVKDNYLRSWFENVIDDLVPKGYGIKVFLTLDNEKSWEFTSSPDFGGGDLFVSKGTISIPKTGGGIEIEDVKVTLFEK